MYIHSYYIYLHIHIYIFGGKDRKIESYASNNNHLVRHSVMKSVHLREKHCKIMCTVLLSKLDKQSKASNDFTLLKSAKVSKAWKDFEVTYNAYSAV